MTNPRNGTVVYELKGRSLAAARKFHSELMKEIKERPPLQSGNGGDIQKSWEKMHENLLSRLKSEEPEVLELTGFNSRVVRVHEDLEGGLPRAYSEAPELIGTEGKASRWFVYSPTDNKGHHFKPQDGQRLTKAETEAATKLLFPSEWDSNGPLIPVKRQGAPLPEGYVPAKNKKSLRGAFNQGHNTYRAFRAGGESLEAIQDLARREKEYSDTTNAVVDKVKAETEKKFPEMLKLLPPGEKLYINSSYSYGGTLQGKTEFHFSVRSEGKHDIFRAGQPVPLVENPAYHIASRYAGEYTVIPRRDTPEGQELANLMDAVPASPSIYDYPQLMADFKFTPPAGWGGTMAALGINGTAPRVEQLNGADLLVYNVDKNASSAWAPPGARALSTETYLWLRADEGDRRTGITPPPMPQQVAKEIAAIFPRAQSAAPAAPAL